VVFHGPGNGARRQPAGARRARYRALR
jgi:hypothetical protein